MKTIPLPSINTGPIPLGPHRLGYANGVAPSNLRASGTFTIVTDTRNGSIGFSLSNDYEGPSSVVMSPATFRRFMASLRAIETQLAEALRPAGYRISNGTTHHDFAAGCVIALLGDSFVVRDVAGNDISQAFPAFEWSISPLTAA